MRRRKSLNRFRIRWWSRSQASAENIHRTFKAQATFTPLSNLCSLATWQIDAARLEGYERGGGESKVVVGQRNGEPMETGVGGDWLCRKVCANGRVNGWRLPEFAWEAWLDGCELGCEAGSTCGRQGCYLGVRKLMHWDLLERNSQQHMVHSASSAVTSARSRACDMRECIAWVKERAAKA